MKLSTRQQNLIALLLTALRESVRDYNSGTYDTMEISDQVIDWMEDTGVKPIEIEEICNIMKRDSL